MVCADTGPHAPRCMGARATIWWHCDTYCVWCGPSAPLPLSAAFIVKSGKSHAVKCDRDTAPAPPGVARYPVQG